MYLAQGSRSWRPSDACRSLAKSPRLVYSLEELNKAEVPHLVENRRACEASQNRAVGRWQQASLWPKPHIKLSATWKNLNAPKARPLRHLLLGEWRSLASCSPYCVCVRTKLWTWFDLASRSQAFKQTCCWQSTRIRTICCNDVCTSSMMTTLENAKFGISNAAKTH